MDQSKPTLINCRFKRQIKLFEKVLGQRLKAGEPPLCRPLIDGEDGEEKPTFFFGARARAQLVDPIVDDSHFDNLAISIQELSSRPAGFIEPEA